MVSIKLNPVDIRAIRYMQHIPMSLKTNGYTPLIDRVHYRVEKGTLIVEATDGYRMCRFEREANLAPVDGLVQLPINGGEITLEEEEGRYPNTDVAIDRYKAEEKTIRAAIPVNVPLLREAIKSHNILLISQRNIYLVPERGGEDLIIYSKGKHLSGEPFGVNPRFILDLHLAFKLPKIILVGSDPGTAFAVENVPYFYLLMPMTLPNPI